MKLVSYLLVSYLLVSYLLVSYLLAVSLSLLFLAGTSPSDECFFDAMYLVRFENGRYG